METNEYSSECPPDGKCRVKAISDIKAFADCLAPNPHACPYARRFGYGMLCYHPEWKEMAGPEVH